MPTDHLVKVTLVRVRNLAPLLCAGLEHVAELTALTSVNLRECRLITNDGLRRLEPLVQLKTFSMSNCTSVTDRGLQSLAKLTGAVERQRLAGTTRQDCFLLSMKGVIALKAYPLLQIIKTSVWNVHSCACT